ncbi:hypothetical protein [Candidatus Sulfurimonas baltica]|uniref:Dinitrogenase iron-molybdenum cofactor biosynthesis domain-containing protein n=1 Tax=Candidatus Sulfurimonas baltica TaxID=2740404 RepID=A0A7S7RN26_9BACT|nr:hypothetical protein [Candidatus Sulfurimonas baltica]QOY51988.1 hypothetical protein HUE88_13005 [Candidatus Sulfurimonas baltica]
MKIAIPVKDENLEFFGNAGHTPKFAIYNMNGTGMFRSFKLEVVKNNPRTDIDYNDEEHSCAHDGDDAAHVAQHERMGTVLDECDYIVVARACKNTANTMNSHGVKIVKYSGDSSQADSILKEVSSQFIK